MYNAEGSRMPRYNFKYIFIQCNAGMPPTVNTLRGMDCRTRRFQQPYTEWQINPTWLCDSGSPFSICHVETDVIDDNDSTAVINRVGRKLYKHEWKELERTVSTS